MSVPSYKGVFLVITSAIKAQARGIANKAPLHMPKTDIRVHRCLQEDVKSYFRALTRALQGRGYFLPRFSAIPPEVIYESSQNFQYPPKHQFDTASQKENLLGSICRP